MTGNSPCRHFGAGTPQGRAAAARKPAAKKGLPRRLPSGKRGAASPAGGRYLMGGEGKSFRGMAASPTAEERDGIPLKRSLQRSPLLAGGRKGSMASFFSSSSSSSSSSFFFPRRTCFSVCRRKGAGMPNLCRFWQPSSRLLEKDACCVPFLLSVVNPSPPLLEKGRRDSRPGGCVRLLPVGESERGFFNGEGPVVGYRQGPSSRLVRNISYGAERRGCAGGTRGVESAGGAKGGAQVRAAPRRGVSVPDAGSDRVLAGRASRAPRRRREFRAGGPWCRRGWSVRTGRRRAAGPQGA